MPTGGRGGFAAAAVLTRPLVSPALALGERRATRASLAMPTRGRGGFAAAAGSTRPLGFNQSRSHGRRRRFRSRGRFASSHDRASADTRSAWSRLQTYEVTREGIGIGSHDTGRASAENVTSVLLNAAG